MEKSALIIDYKYCTGCQTCVVACRKEKDLPVDQWGIKLSEQGPMKLGNKWNWNYVPIPTSLCDLCEDRIDKGLKPACAHHCLAQCMEVVPLSEVSAVLADMGDGVVCFIPFS